MQPFHGVPYVFAGQPLEPETRMQTATFPYCKALPLHLVRGETSGNARALSRDR